MSTVQRDYAHETVVSRPMRVQRNLVIGICVAIFLCLLGMDLIDQKHNIYYLNSMLAAVFCGGMIVSMLRYTRHFVDEMRAGPEYLVARRGKVTVIVPIGQIERVRLAYFANTPMVPRMLPRLDVCLAVACPFGETIAFHPEDGWRGKWTHGPMQKMLCNAERDSIL